MHSRIYSGLVTHTRYTPVFHSFRYRMFMMYLDLDELPTLFKPFLLWSASRPALARFKRSDHYGDSNHDLSASIRDLVHEKTSVRPTGAIRLLTHLRYFGYCMNPVSFYYCRNGEDTDTDFIVAEVHNTPWGETHCYVLDCRQPAARSGDGFSFVFNKEFHVSPFMSMEQQCKWHLSSPEENLRVQMSNWEEGTEMFYANMSLKESHINSKNLASVLIRFPFMTLKVISAIYWQALKLKLKNTPFYPHPRTQQQHEVKT